MKELSNPELARLRAFSARVGSDLLLTQGSTGNCSIKLDGVLWIKASGKWMADAVSKDDVLVPLDLAQINQAINRGIDPAGQHHQASIETAMHAILPHRVVVHLHDVNAIAWAVRQDAPVQLEPHMRGVNWHWIPYVASGLPLARQIHRAIAAPGPYEILLLANHGLVLAADTCSAVEDLLDCIQQRLTIHPRSFPPPELATLTRLIEGTTWALPEDEEVHALGTDPDSQSILSGGLLHPAQSIFADNVTRELFQPVPCPSPISPGWDARYRSRPFLIVQHRGVLIRRPSMSRSQLQMLSGLARIVQRIAPHAPIHYLTEEEVATSYMIATPCYDNLPEPSRDSAT